MDNKDIIQLILERINEKDFLSFISTNKRIYKISNLLCRYRLEIFEQHDYPIDFECILEIHHYISIEELKSSVDYFKIKYKKNDDFCLGIYYKISKIFMPQNRILISKNVPFN